MTVLLDQFVHTLAASGLMTAGDLQAFRDGLRPEQMPESGEELAKLLVRYGKLTKFQAKSLLRGKSKGLVFGDYAVLDRIGAGGMGVVFKARHRRMDRVVALKVLAAKAVKSAGAVDRFHREVKAAARLSHANIVTAHDAGESDGIHYLVMEYVAGQDLSALVHQRGPLPMAEALDYMTQAAQGLQYAHDQNIIHRDIKPANLLLDNSGVVKILDMGLARFEQGLGEEDRDRLTQSGQVMGTCDYMAPEQAEDTHRADRRADIYSLGCTLYRLLAGKSMYSGETLMQILLAHREAPIPLLRAARPDVSEQVDEVYRKMVAKHPKDRYQSMDKVVSALGACRKSLPVASDGQAETLTFQAEEKTDSKLTVFLRGISPARQTIQRQVDMETGAAEASPRARKKNSQPWWLYGVIGVGLAAVLALVVVLMNSGEEDDEPSRVAQAAREPSQPTDPRPVVEPSQPALLEEQAESTATPREPNEMPTPGEDVSEDPPRPESEPVAEVEPPVEDPAIEARRRLLESQRAADAKWAAAMEAVEASVAIWDFASAEQAAQGIQFEEPTLVERLESRRDEIGRMELLKQRIIARLRESDPPLKKSDFRIRGIGGEITAAGPAGITTKTIQGDVERLAWNDLGTEATGKLLAFVVDSTNGDDCLAVALLAFASGNRPAAERFFDQAQSAGADISAQLGAMAAATLTEANEFLIEGDFTKARSLLANLQAKYADLPWLAANRATFDASLATARKGVREAEAEALYAEAVKLHEEEVLFDLRDAVRRLKSEYADCRPVTEASRAPSIADFEQAVADLGSRLIVRLDGKGDFTSIQAAIDAAEPNSLIEIWDNGPYNEQIVIPELKTGLTLRGAKGSWPVVTSSGPRTNFAGLVEVRAANTTMERIFLIHSAPLGADPFALLVNATGFRLRYATVNMAVSGNSFEVVDTTCRISYCMLDTTYIDGNAELDNCILVGGIKAHYTMALQRCTLLDTVILGSGTVILNSILQSLAHRDLGSASGKHRVEHCLIGNPSQLAKTENCFSANPLFRDPANLDFRLLPDSPCIGKASDGGDLGVRCTPELMEVLTLALKLRRQGLIEF